MRKNKLKKKLLLIANVDWFFISHRLCIAERALKEGWEVYVACTDTGRKQEIIDKGVHFINLPISRSGTNPLEEVNTLRNIYSIVKKVQPDVVHHITLKPVIYGSLVAKFLKVKGVVNAIGGLGYNFTGEKISKAARLMLFLMKYAFDRDDVTFIFQNDDDKQELQQRGVLAESNKTVKIKGSGVDLQEFKYTPLTQEAPIKILFPSRMLWDKGVKELREATEILKSKYQDRIQFVLAGLADAGNKAGVSEEFMNEWSDGVYVKWIGYKRNMVPVYQDSHIVVLPSYREGMPKSLLEACAIGRAIVTTDAIGCRECVDERLNGLKVPVQNSQLLADALVSLIENRERLEQMSRASRQKAVEEFDVQFVLNKHMSIYNEF